MYVTQKGKIIICLWNALNLISGFCSVLVYHKRLK